MQATRQGERIVVSVRDHGPGVQAEHLSQLGEPFYRAPGQTAAGHGLGLAIARRAAERHGGSLTWPIIRGRVYCQSGIAAGARGYRPTLDFRWQASFLPKHPRAPQAAIFDFNRARR
jgi:hypothetical protein